MELQLSRRHQRELAICGARKHERSAVSLDGGASCGCSDRSGAGSDSCCTARLFRWLAFAALLLFALATLLRWWVIRTLGIHWNTEVVDSGSLGVITDGPFRWIRHPNYLGVFVELIALPLVHTAWITASVATAGNVFVLRNRLRVEERLLEAVPAYRATMAGKPRFLPRIF